MEGAKSAVVPGSHSDEQLDGFERVESIDTDDHACTVCSITACKLRYRIFGEGNGAENRAGGLDRRAGLAPCSGWANPDRPGGLSKMGGKRLTTVCVPQETPLAAKDGLARASDHPPRSVQRAPRPLAFRRAGTRGVTSLSMILPLSISAIRKSYVAWRRSQSIASPPKYRASRSAVSPVTPRLLRSMSLTRGGVTASAFASAVALRPAGSMKSLRRISPGCSGCVVFLLIGRYASPHAATLARTLEQYQYISYNGIRYEKRSAILTESFMVGELANFCHSMRRFRSMRYASILGNSSDG